jgi:hypothetical protein
MNSGLEEKGKEKWLLVRELVLVAEGVCKSNRIIDDG